MASVAKCLGIMAAGSFVGASGASYYFQSKLNKKAVQDAQAIAKNGKIPIGGRTPDGKMWDGAISVEDFQKNLNKQTKIAALIKGVGAAIFTTLISGLALLLKAKIK